MSKKVLLTGFRPFQGEAINPSELLLTAVSKEMGNSDFIHTLTLPVSFRRSWEILKSELEKNYDVIFLLGQAGGRNRIGLERVALNWWEGPADELGESLPTGSIEPGASPAYFTSLPLTEWKGLLSQQRIPVEISLSAGGFVCNYLYFQALKRVAEQKIRTQVCFVHVPYIPTQVVTKPAGTPWMDFEQMTKGVLALIEASQK
ncbi:MAG: pyroglutamyl-peptidase I [Bdellovibrio sp.]